jgi:hypothetical protein
MSDSRERLMDRCAALANEIAQLIMDANHWNATHPRERPIDPDPTGELRLLHAGLLATLEAEVAREASRPSAGPPEEPT